MTISKTYASAGCTYRVYQIKSLFAKMSQVATLCSSTVGQNAWHFVFQLLEPPVTSLVAATVALEMPRASGALVTSGGALVLQQLIAGCQDWTQVLVATEALDEHLGELLRMGFHRMVATPAILRLQALGWKAEMEKVLDEVLETRSSAGKEKVLGLSLARRQW